MQGIAVHASANGWWLLATARRAARAGGGRADGRARRAVVRPRREVRRAERARADEGSGDGRLGRPRPRRGPHRLIGRACDRGNYPDWVSVLDDILAGVREDLAERQQVLPLDAVKLMAARQRPPRDVVAALVRPRRGGHRRGQALQPERGAARHDRRPGRARPRVRGRWRGDDLACSPSSAASTARSPTSTRSAPRCGIPVLRKDFVVTPYQVWEARAHGADAVLLIVAALEQEVLVSLRERIESLGMTALVEVHDEAEAAARARCRRPRHRGQRPQPAHPRGRPRDVRPARAAAAVTGRPGRRERRARPARPARVLRPPGADAVLVGEGLVKADVPRQAVADLVAAGAHPSCRHPG